MILRGVMPPRPEEGFRDRGMSYLGEEHEQFAFDLGKAVPQFGLLFPGAFPGAGKAAADLAHTVFQFAGEEGPVHVLPCEGLGRGLYFGCGRTFDGDFFQVLSAQSSLTSVFGMGTGGPSKQSTPTKWK